MTYFGPKTERESPSGSVNNVPDVLFSAKQKLLNENSNVEALRDVYSIKTCEKVDGFGEFECIIFG